MELKEFLRTFATISLAILGIWAVFVLFLPIALPFLLAFCLAKLGQSPINSLHQRCKIPHWLGATLVISLLLGVLGLGLYGLARTLWGELSRFTQALPNLLHSLALPMAKFQNWLLTWADSAPISLQPAIQSAIQSVFESGSLLAKSAYEWLFSLVTSTLSRLPQILLFWVTTVIASYMIATQFDGISRAISQKTPAFIRKKWDAAISCFRQALVCWVKAQAKLIGVTFLTMTLGLMILGVEFPFLFGGVIALVDALPLFGASAVLIPWAVLSLIQGQTTQAIGLAILFGTGYFVRSSLEPRIVGKQMGLHPLVSLIALYGGFRLFGVVGMIFCPFAAVLVKQLTAKEGWDIMEP